MITNSKPKTYVTTVRVDLRDIAKIAMFLKENNFEMPDKSKSKLVAMATQMMAEQLGKYKVDMTADAVNILRSLGYGESVIRGRRDFQPLIKQMSKENIVFEDGASKTVESYCAMTRQKKVKITSEELEAARSIIAEEEPVEPAEPSQLKVRTAEDEQKDIGRLKAGLGEIPTEVLEEDKTDS